MQATEPINRRRGMPVRAVRFDGQHVTLDANAADPAPAVNESVVRVLLASPDATDLATVRAQTGHVGTLGRRFVGTVLKTSSDAHAQPAKGARVVAEINLPDASSDLARRGLGRHDAGRRVLGLKDADGCLAERVAIPSRALVEVPDELTDDQALFAVPVADAVHTARLLRLDSKSYVTVIGESVESLLAAQVMARENHAVRLLARDPAHLDLCERWGVRRRHTDEAGRRHDQDVVLVADATPENVDLALGMVRPRGTIVLRSAVLQRPGGNANHADQQASHEGLDLRDAIDREITLIGARCGPVRVGLQTLTQGTVDLGGLISARFGLDDAVGALRAAAEPDSLAVVVDIASR